MGHISPTDGKVITIYHPVSSGKNIIDPIEALACDGTNTNVGAEGGIKSGAEKRKKNINGQPRKISETGIKEGF